ELKQEAQQPDSPKIIKEIFTDKYRLSFKAGDEFERLVDVLQIYSFINKQRGSSETVLRRRLLQLLALYVLEGGCTKDARTKACKMFNVKKETLNPLNHTLRKMGFIVPNQMRSGDDQLNPD